MTNDLKEFAFSSNGDRWFLDSESAAGHHLVIHQANMPSGGARTSFEIADFLKIDKGSPQHAALLNLLASSDAWPVSELSPDQESARRVLGTG